MTESYYNCQMYIFFFFVQMDWLAFVAMSTPTVALPLFLWYRSHSKYEALKLKKAWPDHLQHVGLNWHCYSSIFFFLIMHRFLLL